MELVFSRTMKDIDGNMVDLSYLNKKVVLVVNTASKCELTKQLRGLESLYQRFKNKDFIIIAFPANNFGRQEPLTDEGIAKTYRYEYGVTFPIMSKIDVVEGNSDPLFKELCKRSGNVPEWNFSKYLVNRGRDVFYFPPKETVDNVTARIEATL